ncbi:MAG TPA: shikimate kinase [Candidatus Binataceae bacterium]|nr:shikimate kinase [Candidatus Binataceae bacterium]
MAPKLILTGFMATGKSAVARALAARLGWRFVDCDAEIAARAGKSIPEIFRDSGEMQFRRLEREVIAAIADDAIRCPHCHEPRPAVVATGGGAIVDPANCERLKRAGLIVCLTARPEVIARRIGASARSRPMLTQGGKPLKDRIIELLEARREAYARAAITIDTSHLSIEQVVDEILRAMTAERPAKWRLSA